MTNWRRIPKYLAIGAGGDVHEAPAESYPEA
jgi:hypothetical protein